jgi:hypothetical protein
MEGLDRPLERQAARMVRLPDLLQSPWRLARAPRDQGGRMLSAEQLNDELFALATAVSEGRKRGSRERKSQLAALLHLARTLGAHKQFGYRSLKAYARDELNIGEDALRKYLKAGAALSADEIYTRFLTAVRDGLPRPNLPAVTLLSCLSALNQPKAIELLSERASARKVIALARRDELDELTEALQRGLVLVQRARAREQYNRWEIVERHAKALADGVRRLLDTTKSASTKDAVERLEKILCVPVRTGAGS